MKKTIIELIIVCFFAILIYAKINPNYHPTEKNEFGNGNVVDSIEDEVIDKEQNYEENAESLSINEDITEGEIIEEENADMDLTIRRLEMSIENNKFEDFIFQSEEKAICIYEGNINFDLLNDKFALYKETIEKDIIFISMLFIEKETGNIYTWKNEDLVKIGVWEEAEFEQADVLEPENDSGLLYENISADELLNNVMKVLEQNGCSQLNLIYDGTVEFINRKYYRVSSFDNFEEHILRDQVYYIDMARGYIYCVEENAEYLRTELYYIGEWGCDSDYNPSLTSTMGI